MPGLEGTSLGRYSLKRRLGRGGMAEVYLATDERMHRDVAIKIVSSSHSEFAERFSREAQAMGKLHHDHILPAYDYGEQEPWHYLVMPYIAHGTLSDLLHKDALSLEHAGELLEQVARGLHYAHQQGLLHRDIKPSNILLRDDHYAYLADFGLARVLEGTSDLTQTGTLLGTPEYMAPELAEGPATIGSDIYALAIVLYHMLSGRVPFRGETGISTFWKHLREQPQPPSYFNSNTPEAVDKVLIRALEKEPSRRYPTALALSQAYQDAISGLESMPELYETELMQDAGAQSIRPASVSSPYRSAVTPQTPPGIQPTEEVLSARPSRAQRSRPPFTPVPTSLHNFEQTTDVIPTEVVPSPPSQIRRRQRRRSSNRVLGGVIIGVVFLLVVSGTLAVLAFQSRQQVRTTPTATAQVSLTSTIATNQTPQGSSAKQTATAVAADKTAAAVTATAQVQATHQAISATATAITGSSPQLTDPLNGQSNNGWPDDGLACSFLNNAYFVTVNGSDALHPCISGQLQYGDAAVQIDVTLLSCDNAGLIFRATADANQFYDFEITNHGQFYLRYRSSDGKYTSLIPDTPNSAIHGPGSKNTLLLIARGDDFQLFINEQFVGEAHDTTFANGQLGVAAGNRTASNGDASFSNLRIYKA